MKNCEIEIGNTVRVAGRPTELTVAAKFEDQGTEYLTVKNQLGSFGIHKTENIRRAQKFALGQVVSLHGFINAYVVVSYNQDTGVYSVEEEIPHNTITKVPKSCDVKEDKLTAFPKTRFKPGQLVWYRGKNHTIYARAYEYSISYRILECSGIFYTIPESDLSEPKLEPFKFNIGDFVVYCSSVYFVNNYTVYNNCIITDPDTSLTCTVSPTSLEQARLPKNVIQALKNLPVYKNSVKYN